MRIGSVTLFICGIFLVGLSGLEKVLIYVAGAISFKATGMEQLKDFTPSNIWNIVNYSFFFGIILCVLGFVLFGLYFWKNKNVNSTLSDL